MSLPKSILDALDGLSPDLGAMSEAVAVVAAEVDALKSRLAAAEARAERAVRLLREAEQYGNFGCSDDYHGQIGCASDGDLILRNGWLARIAALLKEVPHGQQG